MSRTIETTVRMPYKYLELIEFIDQVLNEKNQTTIVHWAIGLYFKFKKPVRECRVYNGAEAKADTRGGKRVYVPLPSAQPFTFSRLDESKERDNNLTFQCTRYTYMALQLSVILGRNADPRTVVCRGLELLGCYAGPGLYVAKHRGAETLEPYVMQFAEKR